MDIKIDSQLESHKILRVCSLCKQELDIDLFEKSPKKKYGRGYRCNKCKRTHRYKHVTKLEKECPTCRSTFYALSRQIYCSDECHSKRDMSGNWCYYFNRLLNSERGALSADFLLELLENQGGKCALTGVDLTCVCRKGRVTTNASIDRIVPGGVYEPENVQLVCSAINSFRGNTSLEEFLDWCRKVVSYNE